MLLGISPTKIRITIGSWRPTKERPPRGNLEEIRRKGNEGQGLDTGADWQTGNQQKQMAEALCAKMHEEYYLTN